MNTFSGNVYITPNSLIPQKPPVKMEIDGGEWKIIGYVKDIELSTDDEYDLVKTDYFFDLLKEPRAQRHTITAEFTPGPESDNLWTLLTGEGLKNFSVETSDIDKLKRLLHGNN